MARGKRRYAHISASLLLGLPSSATLEDLRVAHHKLALRFANNDKK